MYRIYCVWVFYLFLLGGSIQNSKMNTPPMASSIIVAVMAFIIG